MDPSEVTVLVDVSAQPRCHLALAMHACEARDRGAEDVLLEKCGIVSHKLVPGANDLISVGCRCEQQEFAADVRQRGSDAESIDGPVVVRDAVVARWCTRVLAS